MDNIKVSLQEISETANKMRSLNSKLAQTLDDVRLLAKQSEGFWDSETSKTFQFKFNALSSTFVKYKAAIDLYATFLDQTVENYRLNETTLNANANTFQ